MSVNHHSNLPSLPCYPCPYDASCCAYGTTISDEEAAAIEADHGPDLFYKTRWGELRTRVRNRRCVLYRDGGCIVHDKAYYPASCRGFPWVDGETGEPYAYDVTICGAFEERPELVELQRAIRPDRRLLAESPNRRVAESPTSTLVATSSTE